MASSNWPYSLRTLPRLWWARARPGSALTDLSDGASVGLDRLVVGGQGGTEVLPEVQGVTQLDVESGVPGVQSDGPLEGGDGFAQLASGLEVQTEVVMGIGVVGPQLQAFLGSPPGL